MNFALITIIFLVLSSIITTIVILKKSRVQYQVLGLLTTLISVNWLFTNIIFQNDSLSFIWLFPINTTIILVIGNYISRIFQKKDLQITIIIDDLADGHIQNTTTSDHKFGLGISASLDKLRSRLLDISRFANEVANGDFETNFNASDDNDEIATSLNQLKSQSSRSFRLIKNVVDDVANSGKLHEKVEVQGLKGEWENLAKSVNQLIESFTGPLIILNKIINGLSRGDLTERYDQMARGELFDMAQNFNAALGNLDGFLFEVSKSAVTIKESATEMSITGEEMTVNTSEIASSISEISNGAHAQVNKVDAVSSHIEDILRSSEAMEVKASEINKVAIEGTRNSENGIDLAQKVSDNMSTISKLSLSSNQSMNKLSQKSEDISRVLNVLSDIATQTNLLALNASIEAAHAGDAGRGFSIVAEEIRKLADESRGSAKEIEHIVLDLQDNIVSVANMMAEVHSSVEVGVKSSDDAFQFFNVILNSSRKTEGFSEDIKQSTSMQKTTLHEVALNIENIVVIAEQTATGTEQIASSATELSSGMEQYKQKVHELEEIAQKFLDGVSTLRLSEKSNENSSMFNVKKAYEQEKMLLDALLNYMPDHIYFKDLESKFIRVSRSMLELHQLPTMNHILGKSDFDFFGEHARKAFENEQQIILSQKAIINQIETEDKKDGHVSYVSTTKLPLRDIEGLVVGTFGISRDVSNQEEQRIEVDSIRKELNDCKDDKKALQIQMNSTLLNEDSSS